MPTRRYTSSRSQFNAVAVMANPRSPDRNNDGEHRCEANLQNGVRKPLDWRAMLRVQASGAEIDSRLILFNATSILFTLRPDLVQRSDDLVQALLKEGEFPQPTRPVSTLLNPAPASTPDG
ncbi:hypothetical protein [Actinoplanes lutulentus]|uniref:hypothetical protein n=1 Tax=Actinoplanes lutulentus TaxID=1287878 RepID=UPI001C66148E|nr:hypothetical protein [Actinoplanes lutulentus]